MQPRANAHPSLPAEVIDLVDDDEDFLEPVADKPLAAPGGVLERRAGDFGQPLPSIADPLQLIDLEDDDEDFQRAVANSLQDQPQQAHRSEGKRAIRESQLIDLDSMNPLPSSSSRPAPAAASGRRRVYGNILDLEDDDEEKSPSPPASALYVSLDSSSTSASSSSSTSSFSSVSSLVDLIVSKHGHGRVQVEAAITTLREAGMGLEQLQDANGIDTVLDVLANEGADAEVECSLCADSGPARKTVVCTGSEAHRICADCASHYISDCKKFATGGPACPSHVAGCDGFYPEGALRRLATPEAFEKMQETMLQRTIVGENYLECPRCHNPSFRDEGAGAHWAHQCPYDGCRTTFCATCREPVAGGQQAHVCRANVHQVLVDETMPGKSDEEKIVAFNKEVIALVKGADALECPRCRKLVLKDEGCNAITCACGCHICWYCGKDTGISHGAHECTMKLPPQYASAANARPGTVNNAQFFSAIDPAVLRRQKRLDEIVSTVKGRREEAWLKKLLALPTWKADKDLKQLIYDPEGAGHDKLNEKASRPRAPAPGVIGNADAARLPPGAFLPLAVDLQRLDERVQAAAAQVAAQLAELDRRLQEIGEGQGQAAARQRAKLQRQRERIAQVQAMQAAHRQAHQAAAAGRQAAVAAALAGGQAAAAAAMAGLMGRRAAAAAAAVAAAAPAAPANPEEQARRMDEARRHVRGAWRNAMEEQLADLVRDVERQRAEEAALRAQDGRGAARRAKELAQQRQASERRVEQLRAQIRQLSARFAAAPAGGAGGAGGGAAGAAAGGAFPPPFGPPFPGGVPGGFGLPPPGPPPRYVFAAAPPAPPAPAPAAAAAPAVVRRPARARAREASPAAAPAAPAAAAAAAAAAARPAGKRRREAPPPPPPEEEEEEAEVEDPMEVDDAPPARPRKQTRGKAPA